MNLILPIMLFFMVGRGNKGLSVVVVAIANFMGDCKLNCGMPMLQMLFAAARSP